MRALLTAIFMYSACFAPVAGAVDSSGHVLLPGDYPAALLHDVTDGDWLALSAGDDSDALVTTPISVEPSPDPIYGDGGGRRVATPALDAEVLFMVRDVPRVQAGPVTTVLADPHYLASDLPVLMFLGSAEAYRLTLDCGAAEGSKAAQRCVLRLRHGNDVQTLARFSGHHDKHGALALGDDAAPALLWAGDLDHDGRLDLLLDLAERYDAVAPTLLLSTQSNRQLALLGTAAAAH